MQGFNRYIVECKCQNQNWHRNLAVRFNRYIVECKLPMSRLAHADFTDLIDT